MVNNVLVLLLLFDVGGFSFYCCVLIFQDAFHYFGLVGQK